MFSLLSHCSFLNKLLHYFKLSGKFLNILLILLTTNYNQLSTMFFYFNYQYRQNLLVVDLYVSIKCMDLSDYSSYSVIIESLSYVSCIS